MDYRIKPVIFGRVSPFNISSKSDRTVLKNMYQILFMNWSEAMTAFDYDNADNIKRDMERVQECYNL